MAAIRRPESQFKSGFSVVRDQQKWAEVEMGGGQEEKHGFIGVIKRKLISKTEDQKSR